MLVSGHTLRAFENAAGNAFSIAPETLSSSPKAGYFAIGFVARLAQRYVTASTAADL
jgi:hypothetical protein